MKKENNFETYSNNEGRRIKETVKDVRKREIHDNRFMMNFVRNLSFFLEKEIFHPYPAMGTLNYYAHAWVEGVATETEYEKGVLTMDYLKIMLEGNKDNFDVNEQTLFGLICSLQVIYIALKPCKEKSGQSLVEKLLNKMEEIRIEILGVIDLLGIL